MSAKAKKVIGLKAFLEVDQTTKKNAQLLDKLDYQAMQLETLTGSTNPTPRQLDELAKVFRSTLKQATPEGGTPQTPPAFENVPDRAGPDQEALSQRENRARFKPQGL